MRAANMKVKDLYKFINTGIKIHLVVYDMEYYPDFIGKFSELNRYRLFNDIYYAVVEWMFFSPDEPDVLYIYVSLKE